MYPRYSPRLFRKVLVPVLEDVGPGVALRVALMIVDAPFVVVAGIVQSPEGESLSAAAIPARSLREQLRQLEGSQGVRIAGRVRAAHEPWRQLLNLIEEERPDLLVVDTAQLAEWRMTVGEALHYPPCDMVVANGEFPDWPADVQCALRGGPYAELSLRIGLAMVRTGRVKLTALHLSPTAAPPLADEAFKGVDRVLRNLPRVSRRHIATDDPAAAILDASHSADVLIMGATARPPEAISSAGPVAQAVIESRSGGVLIVKSSRPFPADINSETAGQAAISVLVDRWFAENTYHAEEFQDAQSLLELKRKQNLRISLALPALNEEATVGRVIQTIKEAFVREAPLVDELVLVDSASTDHTREIARAMGVPVHIHQEVLPQLGSRNGKGEALWKSLFVTTGDILIWLDTDIANFHPRFVYGLLGPLITRPDVQFVKGFYRRPLRIDTKLQAGGGGRVTELTARPLLNLFFPELSGIIQPLSGEYGGRRSALEQLPFSSGYGVEIGLLIDVFEKFGLESLAQVDLQERIHHNQPLESLSKMSFAIIQTVVRRIEKRYGIRLLEDVNKTMKLIQYGDQRLLLSVEEIAELERPPMADIPEYGASVSGNWTAKGKSATAP